MTTTKIFACLFIPLIMDVLPSCGIATARDALPFRKPVLFDPTTQATPILTVHTGTGPLCHVAFGPDGKYLAAGSGDLIILWNAKTGRKIHTFRGHTNEITSLAFSPDGKSLASTAHWDDTGRIWDTKTGRLFRRLTWIRPPQEKAVFSRDGKQFVTICACALVLKQAVFSPDGKQLATPGFAIVAVAGEKNVDGVKLWDVATGRPTATLRQFNSAVNAVAYSPDGQRLASGNQDGTIVVWNLATNKPVLRFRAHSEPISGLAYSPDGRSLASAGGDGKAKIWELKRLAPAGKTCVGTGRLCDLTGDRNVLVMNGHGPAIISVVWSTDSKYLASVCINQGYIDDSLANVSVWDATTGKELVNLGSGKYGHPGTGGVAFSPDGKRLATAHTKGTVKIWDLAELLGQKLSK